MLTLVQIIGLVILIVFFFVVVNNIRKKGYDIYKLAMLVVTIILIGMIILQESIRGIVTALGFVRPFELFITTITP